MIARFGPFLRLIALQLPDTALVDRSRTSAILGIAFVVVGANAIPTATVRYRRFVRTLALVDLPASYNRGFALLLSSVLGILGCCWLHIR